MSGETYVTQDELFFIADFIVDELTPSESQANDTKKRMRRYMSNLSTFQSARARGAAQATNRIPASPSKLPGQQVPGQSNNKRKQPEAPENTNNKKKKKQQEPGKPAGVPGTPNKASNGASAETKTPLIAGGNDSAEAPELPAVKGAAESSKAAAKKGDKKDKNPSLRAVTIHNAFITYGKNCTPASVQDTIKKNIPGAKTMMVFQKYKSQLPGKLFEEFKAEYQPVLDEFNADPERKKGDMATLQEMFKAHDSAKGIDLHPTFKGLKEFVIKEGKSYATNDAAAVTAATPSAVTVTATPVTAATPVTTASKPNKSAKAEPKPAPVAAPGEETEETDSSDDDTSDDE